MKSQQSSANSDRLIELRIAREALYGKGATHEKAFPLSTYGGWHVGGAADERRAIRDTLHKAYDDASRAIHAGQLKHTIRDEQLLPTTEAVLPGGHTQAARRDGGARAGRIHSRRLPGAQVKGPVRVGGVRTPHRPTVQLTAGAGASHSS